MTRSPFQTPLALLIALLLGTGGCEKNESAPGPRAAKAASASASPELQKPPRITLSIVGTNDLHGRIAALPLLGGYLHNLREARKADGGVLLLDAGDLFQGTLESNQLEGEPVVRAYAALGYHAVTVGNHEFDFGPVGPAATPEAAGDDPRGALRARAKQAPFPFLMANVTDKKGAALGYANMPPSVLVEVAGVSVGLVGVTTEDTLTTTISANVRDLEIKSLSETIERAADDLRGRGATVVVALAHAGGKCKTFTGSLERDTCETSAEIFKVARKLAPGKVDVIVAGHTHAGVAHAIGSLAIIEQFSYGRAFGRVDLSLEGGKVVDRHIFAPQDLCPGQEKPDFETCVPADYEGHPVSRDAVVSGVIQYAVEAAEQRRHEKLGVELSAAIKRDYDDESALGNLMADFLRTSEAGADVGLMNGGGLRADLPAGELSYGALFESFPFDNRVATVDIPAGTLKALLSQHLQRSGGILSVSGVSLRARCDGPRLVVELRRGKKKLSDDTRLRVVGSDFLFTGGDSFWGDLTPPEVDVSATLMRDRLEGELRKQKRIAPSDFFDPKARRLELPKQRPIKCP